MFIFSFEDLRQNNGFLLYETQVIEYISNFIKHKYRVHNKVYETQV